MTICYARQDFNYLLKKIFDRKSRFSIVGRRRMVKTRLIFSTDVHGSELFWRKWMRSGEHYGADIIIMSGDLTGKAIIPIIKGNDDYQTQNSKAKPNRYAHNYNLHYFQNNQKISIILPVDKDSSFSPKHFFKILKAVSDVQWPVYIFWTGKFRISRPMPFISF